MKITPAFLIAGAVVAFLLLRPRQAPAAPAASSSSTRKRAVTAAVQPVKATIARTRAPARRPKTQGL